MSEYSPKSQKNKSLKLKKLIMQQYEIHKKAEKVMSNTPPNLTYATRIKAKYVQPSRLVSLPPMFLHTKPVSLNYSKKSVSPRVKKTIPEIGIIQGIQKFFSVRRKSKSQDMKKIRKAEVINTRYSTTDIDVEISPMTILVKLKEHNYK